MSNADYTITARSKQYLQVQLDGQNTQINLYTTVGGLFMDVLVNDVAIISGVICQNLNPIVQNGFLVLGDLAFMDMQGSSDPEYTDWGLAICWRICPKANLVEVKDREPKPL